MDKIKKLIQEGEELKGTFVTHDLGFTLTNDTENLSRWIIECTMILRNILSGNDIILKKFENQINNMGNTTLEILSELIGTLKGLEATEEEYSL